MEAISPRLGLRALYKRLAPWLYIPTTIRVLTGLMFTGSPIAGMMGFDISAEIGGKLPPDMFEGTQLETVDIGLGPMQAVWSITGKKQ